MYMTLKAIAHELFFLKANISLRPFGLEGCGAVLEGAWRRKMWEKNPFHPVCMKRHLSTPFIHATFNYNRSGGQRSRAWESFPRSFSGERRLPGMPGWPGDLGCASCIAHIPTQPALCSPCPQLATKPPSGVFGWAQWGDWEWLGLAWDGVDVSSSYSLCCWAAPAAPHPRGERGHHCPAGLRDCNPHFQLVPILVTHTQCCRNGCSRELTSDFLATPFSAMATLLGCCAWFVCSVWVAVPATSLQRCEVVGWPSGRLKVTHQATWRGHGNPFPCPPGIWTALRWSNTSRQSITSSASQPVPQVAAFLHAFISLCVEQSKNSQPYFCSVFPAAFFFAQWLLLAACSSCCPLPSFFL